MTIRYRIQTSKGKVIFCGLLPYETTLIKHVTSQSQKVGDIGIRAGIFKNDSYTVYGFSSDPDFLKSSQKFKTQLNVIFVDLLITFQFLNSFQDNNLIFQ